MKVRLAAPIAFAATTACAVLIATVGTAAGVRAACSSISVWTGRDVFTYTVKIEPNRQGCAAVRAALRRYIDDEQAPRGWTCARGHGAVQWAVTCARGGSRGFAYGPVREADRWIIAAAKLRMPVLAPQPDVALSLRYVRVNDGACSTENLAARYTGKAGATLWISEGKPYTCGNVGAPPVLGTPRIHGRLAELAEACVPAGCSRTNGEYSLVWRERGIQLVLFTRKIDEATLIAVARSMKLVLA